MMERIAGWSSLALSVTGYFLAQTPAIDNIRPWADLGGMAMFGFAMWVLLRERNRQASESEAERNKMFQASLEKIFDHSERQHAENRANQQRLHDLSERQHVENRAIQQRILEQIAGLHDGRRWGE